MFSQATPVVRNLLIINVIFYVVTHMLAPDLAPMLAGYYPAAPQFQPWQIVTHMFMHASLGHIFFNMFALYMFGSQLEQVWGPQALSQLLPHLRPWRFCLARAGGRLWLFQSIRDLASECGGIETGLGV